MARFASRTSAAPASSIGIIVTLARSIKRHCLRPNARALAETTGRADPDAAWCSALLAPLGWMALCAIAAGAATACLESNDFAADPCGAQQRLWGMDQASIGRRLCRRWGLPAWLAVVIGHLDLAVEHAEALGADGELFRIVQLAVASVETNPMLRLSVGVPAEENAIVLGVTAETVAKLQLQAVGQVGDAAACVKTWDAPESMPLLRDLLLMAAEKRRLSEAPVLVGLESDIDRLHQALRNSDEPRARLHTHKLAALAGLPPRGHEINNPFGSHFRTGSVPSEPRAGPGPPALIANGCRADQTDSPDS